MAESTSLTTFRDSSSQPVQEYLNNDVEFCTSTNNRHLASASSSTWTGSNSLDYRQAYVKQNQLPDHPVTTLMMCNIPCRLGHWELASALDSLGFRGRYDFLHLMTGSKSGVRSRSNLGYGFVNFMTPQDAEAFTEAFHGFRFQGTSSRKSGLAKPAYVQGFLATLDMLRPADSKHGVRGFFTCSL
uniref:Mei2-like C-terminal RNA recognition motif domain-containing protein n=1 Tax=Alexandrium monilatum TaxID=311494 RepID=A0A7S4PSC6_9DINO